MNLISIFGAGLLVGAALVVIVPEGMLVLFNSMSNLDNYPAYSAVQEYENTSVIDHPDNESVVLISR